MGFVTESVFVDEVGSATWHWPSLNFVSDFYYVDLNNKMAFELIGGQAGKCRTKEFLFKRWIFREFCENLVENVLINE